MGTVNKSVSRGTRVKYMLLPRGIKSPWLIPRCLTQGHGPHPLSEKY
uniref:Uncharacterized protein n=1 Tax=Anguilla anguilla TaxID=7936 RepID=A0A0E9R1K4_ANGAN